MQKTEQSDKMWDESCGGSIFWEELSGEKKMGQYLTSDDMRRSHWCSRDHSWLAHDLPLISPKISPHTHPSISHHAPRPLSLSTPLFLELGTFRQAQNLLSSPPGDRFKIWAGLLGHGVTGLTFSLLHYCLGFGLSGVAQHLLLLSRCTLGYASLPSNPIWERVLCIILCSSVSYSVALYHTL